jgi:hypothetical protein
MGISSKLAKYISKEKKAVKGKPEAKDVKADLKQMEMQKLKKAELQELAKGRGEKAKAAKLEIERRQFNREYGSSGEGGEAMSGPMQRELKKFYRGEKEYDQLDPKAMRFGDEEFRKGGMVKKKAVAAKKPIATKKPAIKKPMMAKKGK